MFTQNEVLRTLNAPELQARLTAVVGDAALSTRAAIVRRVCELVLARKYNSWLV
ncbi:MAG: hypothetical protein OXD43_04775 [Bacteroidetes bacterium]|nr:hypothetical protein [Bacteroidota bacterium]